ncbi:nucleotide-diphospho-sugar transferase [Terfezia claveryi]|nr:nucleotide-diphospho-sugar transferase [Terfezia claveryi]
MTFCGPRRLRTRLLLPTSCLILLCWSFTYSYHYLDNGTSTSSLLTRLRNFKPPERERKIGGTVIHETQDIPEFQFYSPYRGSPDVEFEEMLDSVLREIERKLRPERTVSEGWPKKIWQVWLSKGWQPGDLDSDGFSPEKETQDGKEDQKIRYMKAWKEVNPDYEHTLLTDLKADTFVSTYYSSIPALVHLYRTFPVPVMKADLLRYLLLFIYGGVWVDHDVWPVKPLSACPFQIHLPTSESGVSPHTSLLVGIEIDEPFVTAKTRRHWHWSRIYGLIQYHMVAKPFSPFLRRAIVRVVAHAYTHGKRKNSGVKGLWGWVSTNGGVWTGEYSEIEILEITGPGVWTDAILDTLTDAVLKSPTPQTKGFLDTIGEEERVTWRAFSGITKPTEVVLMPGESASVRVEVEPVGIYVLPINFWGNGQRHSGAKNFLAEEACVNHLFLRSWKKGWYEWAFG